MIQTRRRARREIFHSRKVGYLQTKVVAKRQIYACLYLLCRNSIGDSLVRVSLVVSCCIAIVCLLCGRRSTVEQANPPRWRVERAAAVVKWREDVIEVVPDWNC